MKKETIRAKGNRNVTARHRTTLEFTKEKHLTLRGDCIIAVSADKGMQEFSEEFKNALRNNSRLEITIKCSGLTEKVMARGHPGLRLKHPTDIVVRKSNFICDRTLAIKSNKSAFDLNRNFVEKLKEENDIIIELKILE